MKRLFTLLLASGFLASNLAMADVQLKKRAKKSKKVVKEFMVQLKGELKGAMKEGGPLNAIEVCNKRAPEIAKDLSSKYGWTIARTSLKTRNPSNKPDAWEEKVLKDFEQRKAKGDAVKTMAFFEAVGSGSEKQFRFMKAIPTGEVCLKCHGQNIPEKVKASIDKFYPDDQATGFSKGDIRGAFTITQPW